MLEFILISAAWFFVGYLGGRLLMRKGHTLDGLDAIREDLFVHRSVGEIMGDARGNYAPSSVALFVVGGPITLLIGLLMRPKKLHAPQ